MKLGEFIKETRKSRDVSRTELADRLSLNESDILRFEIGQTVPNLAQLKIIALSLGVPLDDLLDCDGVLLSERPREEEEKVEQKPKVEFIDSIYDRDQDGTISSSSIDDGKARQSRIYGVFVTIPLSLIGIIVTIIGMVLAAGELNDVDHAFTRVMSIFMVVGLIVSSAVSLVGAFFFSKLKTKPKTFAYYMLVVAIINIVSFFISLGGGTFSITAASFAAMQLMIFLFMINKMKSIFPSKIITIVNIVVNSVSAIVMISLFYFLPVLALGMFITGLASISNAVGYYFVTTSFTPSNLK